MNIYSDRQREGEEGRTNAYVIIEHKNKNGGRDGESVFVCVRVGGIVIESAIEQKRKKNVRDRKEKEKSEKNRDLSTRPPL